MAEWDRRVEMYRRYLPVIEPRLPASVRRLCRNGLHDAVVRKATVRGRQLVLLLDAGNALSVFRGKKVMLTFRGLRARPDVTGLVGQWWLYAEVHLSAHAAFNLQVLLDHSELEIEADALEIRRVR